MRKGISPYKLIRFAAVAASLLFVMSGCGRTPRHDERLMEVYELSETHPEDATSKLNSIPTASLREPDKHFFDFMEVKLRDKNFIKPSGDDSIKALLAYYESHEKEWLYPQVLYYAGRTYSDLGDYPRALDYYQKALSELPEEERTIHLRGNILSQFGRLLNRFRLYEEAIPYLEWSLEITRHERDSLNMMYDLQLLGRIKMDAGHIDEAKKNFNEALAVSEQFGKKAMARSRMYLASAALEEGDPQAARALIHGIPETVSALTMGQALALAAQIYHEAGILDSANYYAKKLIDGQNEKYRRNSYHILLSPDMSPYVDKDSLPGIAMAYAADVHERFDENERDLVLLQQSTYNYTIAQREKEEVSRKNETLRKYLFGSLVIILLLVIGILLFAIRRTRHKTRLFKVIGYLSQLSSNNKGGRLVDEGDPTSIVKLETIDQLHEMIEKVLERLRNAPDTTAKITVDSNVLQSEAYASLKSMAENNRCITQTSTIMRDLEHVVHECRPSFKADLCTITEGRMTQLEYETALLMKGGFSTTEISVLLGRSKSAISQRKESLAHKIAGFSIGKRALDNVISNL